MISVCMAVKNGAPFLTTQLESILPQLAAGDEIIISDDHSTDKTCEIIANFSDPRVKLVVNPQQGLVSNFENAITCSRGEIIFLSDQDDVWMPNKIEVTLPYFETYDLVVSDCTVVNEHLDFIHDSFFQINSSSQGIVRNLVRNSYMGCCMAFKRSLLKKALPFPKDLIIHDQWLGLVAELYGRVVFHPHKLVLHRRHGKNTSTTSGKSKYHFMEKFANRFNLVFNLIGTRYAS